MSNVVVGHSRLRMEHFLGHRMTPQQDEVFHRIMDAEPQQLVSVPMPRRSGKTSLAIALMRAISDAIVVVDNYSMAGHFDRHLGEMSRNRVHTGTPDLRNVETRLIIFDETQDIRHLEQVRQHMPHSRLLHMYTPRGMEQYQEEQRYGHPVWRQEFIEPILPWDSTEATGSFDGANMETLTSVRIEHDMLRARQRQMDSDLELLRSQSGTTQAPYEPLDEQARELMDLLMSVEGTKKKKKNKEWDEDENSM